MFAFLKRHRKPIAVLVTVLLPLIVYRSQDKVPGDLNVFDRVVLLVTGPLQSLMVGAVGIVSDGWSNYVDVVGAREENAELRQRLRKLELERDRLADLGVENEHLRQILLVDHDNPSLDLVVAKVIGAGNSPSARTILVDRGALDGVELGQTVTDGRGLVGVVQRVGWKQSEVLLIADDKVSFHASVLRTRARGRIRGMGLGPDFRVQLTEVLRSDDVEVGDQIVTNGLGGVFPRGLFVGVVKNVRVEKGVQHRIADVVPYVDFARLETVAIVVAPESPEIIATPEPLLPPSLQVDTSTAEATE